MQEIVSRPIFSEHKAWIGQEEPVSVSDVKAQLRFVFDEEDGLIEGYIASARDLCESELNRKLRRQRVELTYSAWNAGLRLDRMGHDVEIESIKYSDSQGITRQLDSTAYRLQKRHLMLVVPAVGVQWPDLEKSAPTITVTLQAGYLQSADIPRALKNWICAVAASMFRNRESHSEKPMSELEFIGGLLDQYRISIV